MRCASHADLHENEKAKELKIMLKFGIKKKTILTKIQKIKQMKIVLLKTFLIIKFPIFPSDSSISTRVEQLTTPVSCGQSDI